MDRARRVAEQAARASYGRLVALLAARTRDVAAAEDALAEAFAAALCAWPESGVPDRPEAWLLTAARRTLGHVARHAGVREAAVPALVQLAEAATDQPEFPDERLKLLFVCAHPAIDPAARAPLMLQTVLGLDAARIASAFLVSPATMSQRLVRAKTRIRDAGIGFQVPEAAELPDRLEAVLEACYAAYGMGWDAIAGTAPRVRDLTEEAIWLARLVVALMADQPEARGLLALMLFCEARTAARRDPSGAFVPLDQQDTALWDGTMIAEAERHLATAVAQRVPGRFQIEAAIQSAHAVRRGGGEVPWSAIVTLYAGLVAVAPTIGAAVGHAAAVAQAQGAAAGLALLDGLGEEATAYQPALALRAHLLARLGDSAAGETFTRAAALAGDPAVAAWLLSRAP